MNQTDWMEIPGRLKRAGYAVCYGRISYDPDRPLWSAKARRDGREWSAMARNLSGAFLELEAQIGDASENWREIIAQATTEANYATGTA